MSHSRNACRPSERSTCIVAECERPAAPHRELCVGHYARKVRGQPLDTPLREWGNPARALMEAAFAFADAAAEDDDAYVRAWNRLRKAARRY